MFSDEATWQKWREEICLEPGTTYLNTGSYAPLPKPVFAAVSELRARLARSPSDFYWRQTPPALVAARVRLAEFLSVAPAQLLLVPNATYGVNLVVCSLDLPANSEVLLSDQEYGAMRYCFDRFAGERKLRVREVPIRYPAASSEQIVEQFRTAVSPQTRVLFFSHVTSPTGLVLPAKALCALAAEHDILSIVDGAHAPGMLPLDLGEVGADFYAGNCHKWMMAPTGAAFLHCQPHHRDGLRPLITSWGWDFDRAQCDWDSGWGASFWARNLEFVGTQDRCAQMVLPNVLDFRAAIGDGAIERRVTELAQYTRTRISALGYSPANATPRDLSGSMTAFEFPPVDLLKARDWIWNEHQIEAPFTEAAGRCFLRVSTAWFNTPEEIDRLAEAIGQFPLDKLRR